MSDLISRKALIEEIQLMEQELMKEKEEAKEIGDTEVVFAIDNQLSGLWQARCKVSTIGAAYDVDKVVSKVADTVYMIRDTYGLDDNCTVDYIEELEDIVKGGLEE